MDLRKSERARAGLNHERSPSCSQPIPVGRARCAKASPRERLAIASTFNPFSTNSTRIMMAGPNCWSIPTKVRRRRSRSILYTDLGLVPMKTPFRRDSQSPESCVDP